MSDHESLEERVRSLEELVGFQDRSIAKLNDVVTQFAVRVQQLEGELKQLRADEEQEVGPQSDPPPHY